MVISDTTVQQFSQHLQRSILLCSDRCLYYAANWAAEILCGIKEGLIDGEIPFSDNEVNQDRLSVYYTDYERGLEPLTEREYNKYQHAKTLFNLRQFDYVSTVLKDTRSSQCKYLRLYAKYLAYNKRREEARLGILEETEDRFVDTSEVDAIYDELSEGYARNELDAFLLYLYGVILRTRKVESKAAFVLLQSISQYPYNWAAWTELSTLVNTKKMLRDVEALLEREIDPNNIMKVFFLAKLSAEVNFSLAEFKKYMDPLTTYFANSPYVKSQWAIFFYESMEYNDAIVLFEDLRRNHPCRLEDLDVYSNLLYIVEDEEKLYMLAEDCTRVDKCRPETCCVLGNYHSMKREMAESIEAFKFALKLRPHYHLAWTLLGYGYFEMKNTGAAIECYRKAVESNNKDYRAWCGLGHAYDVMKLPYDALYYYRKATEIRYHDPRMWETLAGCHTALNQFEEAKECRERAIGCNRMEKYIGIIQIGNLFDKMGNREEALRYYGIAWELRDEGVVTEEIADVSLILARNALKERRYDLAETFASVALDAKHPYHDEARKILDELIQLNS
ncbi:hypothetical protein BDB01DRAFT_784023 [Pilobolus umbonatus]|nr:hypothetical protein BDB01DRAFT_784023 [Pilobolus umbonatus]